MSVSTNLLSTSNSVDPKPFETSGISPCKLNRNQRTQVHNYDMPSGFQPSKLLSARHHPGCSWCQTSLLRWPHCTWHPRPKPPCPEDNSKHLRLLMITSDSPQITGPIYVRKSWSTTHIRRKKKCPSGLSLEPRMVWHQKAKKGTTLNSLGSSQNFVLCFGNRKKLKAMRFQRC